MKKVYNVHCLLCCAQVFGATLAILKGLGELERGHTSVYIPYTPVWVECVARTLVLPFLFHDIYIYIFCGKTHLQKK